MRITILLVSLLSLASCSTPLPPDDTGVDTGIDAGHDSGLDASDAEDAAIENDAADEDAPDVDAARPCEVVAPTACPDPMPVYADVEPIILARCVVCHDGSGDEWPLSDYEHVRDWAPDIRADLLACEMPPPSSGRFIPTDESQLILNWLRCGLPR